MNACQNGAILCVGGRGATPETCDGSDEDCDGTVDENPGGSTLPGTGVRCGATDVGACVFGTVSCVAGALACGGTLVGSRSELCNGIDDDCDGVIDDSPRPPTTPPASCAETRGVCGGRTPECQGAAGWQCVLPPTYLPVEVLCDNLDNDCDGTRDEGCLTPQPASDVRVDLGTSPGAQNSVQVQLSGNGGNTLYAAWMETIASAGHVYHNRSTNLGTTWSSPSILLDDAGGAAIGPRFGVTGSSLQVVNVLWSDFRGGTNYREIYSDRSVNSGATFPNASRRHNPGMNIDTFNVETAVSGSNVYVVYEAFTSPRTRHIFFIRSTDEGATYSSPLQLDHGTGTSFIASTPKIAASGNNVHVLWRDNRNGALDVFYVRSTDAGSTFSASDVRIDGGSAGGASSFDPVIAAEGTNVYAAWVDDRSGNAFDIYFNRSTNSGGSWRTATVIDDDILAHDSFSPRLVTTGTGRLVVVWVDLRSGFSDIIARYSGDAGATFDPAQRLDTSTAAGTSASADLAIDALGSLVGAAWADDRGGLLDIYANFSLDGGRTWQPRDARLDSGAAGAADSERPSVYVSTDSVHVAWIDHRNGANGDVYTRRLGP